MTSLTSLKHHTKIGKSKTESVLNFFPPLYAEDSLDQLYQQRRSTEKIWYSKKAVVHHQKKAIRILWPRDEKRRDRKLSGHWKNQWKEGPW